VFIFLQWYQSKVHGGRREKEEKYWKGFSEKSSAEKLGLILLLC
jgi:hypothetical protein